MFLGLRAWNGIAIAMAQFSREGNLKRPRKYGRIGFWAGWKRLSEHSTPSEPFLWKGRFVRDNQWRLVAGKL